MSITLFLCVLGAGWFCGWISAHRTVAQECEERGWFFVGRKTYRCVEITVRTPKADNTLKSDDPPV